MKTLRQLSVALVFTLALAVPAFAGQIDTTVAPPQPVQTATADGQIDTTVMGQTEPDSGEATAADAVAEAVLNLLHSLLSLF